MFTGVTQVSKEKQVPFDVLPKPAPGLKTADPTIKLLHALSNALCTRYTDEQLKPLDGGVKYVTKTAPREHLHNTEVAPLRYCTSAQSFRHRCMPCWTFYSLHRTLSSSWLAADSVLKSHTSSASLLCCFVSCSLFTDFYFTGPF